MCMINCRYTSIEDDIVSYHITSYHITYHIISCYIGLLYLIGLCHYVMTCYDDMMIILLYCATDTANDGNSISDVACVNLPYLFLYITVYEG